MVAGGVWQNGYFNLKLLGMPMVLVFRLEEFQGTDSPQIE